MNGNKWACLPLLFLVLSVFSLPADLVRGTVTSFAAIDAAGESRGSFQLNDLASFTVTASPYLAGVEISFTVPKGIAQFRDGFALSLYSGVSPSPSSGIVEYRGDRQLFRVLPGMNTFSLLIPLKQGRRMPASPGSIVLERPVPPEQFPVLLTITPVMKGIPPALQESRFHVTAKPVLDQLGMLILSVDTEGVRPDLRILVNDEPVDGKEERFLLPPGIHQLRIEAEGYRSVVRSFGIEQARETEVSVELRRQDPQLVFHLPSGITLFLNGEQLDPEPGRPVSVGPGEHVVLVKLGDFRMSKRFTVENDTTYNISLFLDILIQEN